MNNNTKIAAILLGAVIANSAARADNLVANGSFELGADPGSNFITLWPGNPAVTGWTIGGVGVDYIGGFWQAADGGRSLDMSSVGAGSVTQQISTIAGQLYNVSFSLAGNPYGAPTLKEIAASVDNLFYNIFSFDVTNKTATNMGWATEQFTFTGDGSTHALTFFSLDNTAYGPALDNVSMTAVPGPIAGTGFPALLSLLGLGVLWRRQKAA